MEIVNHSNIIEMPVIALRGMTVFPNMLLHFDVGREKSIKALEQAMQSGQNIFLVAQKELVTDDPKPDEIFSVGTISKIKQLLRLPNQNLRILVEGSARASVVRYTQTAPFVSAEVLRMNDPETRKTTRSEANVRFAQELFEEYMALAPKMTHEVFANVASATEPGYLADYIAQNIAVKYTQKQEILEELNPLRRLHKVIALLNREIDILDIEHDIQDKIRTQIGKNQRDYFLREQIKVLQSELGEGEEPSEEAEDYKARILKLKLPPESEKKLLKEAARISRMHFGSPESALLHTYLDTCLELPWHKTTKDRLDIGSAENILNNDHYGLEKVKERVLEFLAVKQLAPNMKGQILCLVGPPGVGKTSIAMSVARAVGRKLARLSLGGVRDEADIRGHRKTYIGAMPGRIMTAVGQAGSRNPLLLLDEIDKMGNDFRGDPSAALLEVLDSEQNHAFRDHFLEIPFDLSDVMFITTANTTDTIPRPLLDRMEVIRLTSYTDEEKLHIAKRYLLPKQMKIHGLKASMLKVNDSAMREIIACYTRESGVRRLEREIAAVCRKSAKKITTDGVKKVTVTPENIPDFLGVRKFRNEKLRSADEVGLANGLAWTSVGGEILEVEANAVPGSGKIELTGNLGTVMKESAKAAMTFIRSRADSLGIDPEFYKNLDIHVHFPEGAIPKDGPSAGITMACALISALTGAPVKRDIAMTGEITLRGRVLPIGGLKEKTMAAYRAGIRTVIIPAENEKDLQDIDRTVYTSLDFIAAEHMDAVVKNALNFSLRDSLGAKTHEPDPETEERRPVRATKTCKRGDVEGYEN